MRYRFAPLGGETFQKRLLPAQQFGLPDSLVVLTAGGDIFVRSRAVLRILHSLGGGFAVLSWTGRLVPRFLADALYDCIARTRKKIFKKPDAACPMVNSEQGKRFDP